MKLYDAIFEGELRRGVKRAVSASPELKREFKRNQQRRRPVVVVVLGALVWCILPLILPAAMAGATRNAATGLAVLALLDSCFVLLVSQTLLVRLYTGRDLAALYMLPIEDDKIFRWKMDTFVWKSQAQGLIFLGGGLAGIGFALGFSAWQYAVIIPVALLTWATHVALAIHLTAWLPRRVYRFTVLGGMFFGVALYAVCKVVGRVLLVEYFKQYAWPLLVCLPMGWPMALLNLALPQPQWVSALLLVPVGVMLAMVPHSLRRLRENFGYREREQMNTPSLAPDIMPGTSLAEAMARRKQSGEMRHVGESEITEIVQFGRFLDPPTWPGRGVFEGWFWRALNARERVVTEVAFPEGVTIAKAWKPVFKMELFAVVGALAVGFISPVWQIWVIGFGIFVATILGLVTFLRSGRAFFVIHAGGVRIPIYAAFGVGFDELSAMLFKLSLAQMPLLFVFALVASLTVMHIAHGRIAFGVALAVKFTALALMSRLVVTLGRFSGGSNDNAQFRLRTMPLFCGMAIAVVGFLILGIVGVALPSMKGWLISGGAVLDAMAGFFAYRWFYFRGRFDLMNFPRR